MNRTDFLDVCFDLENGSYCPYRKPNDAPLHINTKSNHPSIIKKQLPQMNAHSLLDLSCSEEMFSKATPEYKQSLRNSGFGENINHLSHSATYAPKNERRRNKVAISSGLILRLAIALPPISAKNFSCDLLSTSHPATAFVR